MEKTRLAAQAYLKSAGSENLDGFEAELDDEKITLPALRTQLSSPEDPDLSVVSIIISRSLIREAC